MGTLQSWEQHLAELRKLSDNFALKQEMINHAEAVIARKQWDRPISARKNDGRLNANLCPKKDGRPGSDFCQKRGRLETIFALKTRASEGQLWPVTVMVFRRD